MPYLPDGVAELLLMHAANICQPPRSVSAFIRKIFVWIDTLNIRETPGSVIIVHGSEKTAHSGDVITYNSLKLPIGNTTSTIGHHGIANYFGAFVRFASGNNVPCGNSDSCRFVIPIAMYNDDRQIQ